MSHALTAYNSPPLRHVENLADILDEILPAPNHHSAVSTSKNGIFVVTLETDNGHLEVSRFDNIEQFWYEVEGVVKSDQASPDYIDLVTSITEAVHYVLHTNLLFEENLWG